MDHDEAVRLYGPWAGRTPQDARRLLDGFAGTWWMAGGWALEAYTGVSRPHDDCDPSVLRADVPALRRHLAGRLDVWTATDGTLCPLVPDDRPDLAAADLLPSRCGNVWLRPSALDPWEYDVLLSPGDRDTWVYRRDPAISMPMSEALWERDGIRYLQPEIQLLYKSKGPRPKDHADLVSTLPHLDSRRRRWLADNLDRTHPGHPWHALVLA